LPGLAEYSANLDECSCDPDQCFANLDDCSINLVERSSINEKTHQSLLIAHQTLSE
jgi:hypothetical protein